MVQKCIISRSQSHVQPVTCVNEAGTKWPVGAEQVAGSHLGVLDEGAYRGERRGQLVRLGPHVCMRTGAFCGEQWPQRLRVARRPDHDRRPQRASLAEVGQRMHELLQRPLCSDVDVWKHDQQLWGGRGALGTTCGGNVSLGQVDCAKRRLWARGSSA